MLLGRNLDHPRCHQSELFLSNIRAIGTAPDLGRCTPSGQIFPCFIKIAKNLRVVYPQSFKIFLAFRKQSGHYPTSPKIHQADHPMRALWITLALCLIPGMSRADVVVYEQSTFNSGILINNVSSSYGQAFTNTAGNVAVKSVTFYFAQQAGATSGNLSVSIYATDGSSGSYTPTGTAVVTSDSRAFTTGANLFNFSSATTLGANSTYVAVLNLSSLNLSSTNSFNVEINPLSGSQYATSNGVFYNANDQTPAWVAQAYQIRGSIVMVPEPGTLLLGGIAATCGGGGVWWRRRRLNAKQPAATETAG